MPTIQQFHADLKGFAEKMKMNFDTAVKKVVFDLHRSVTEISPVDTGRFRASWGVHPIQIPDDPGEPLSESGLPNSVPAGNSKKRVKFDSKNPYQIWYIYNNLPYARKLEEGSSKKAPNGILNLALAQAEAEIDTLLARIL